MLEWPKENLMRTEQTIVPYSISWCWLRKFKNAYNKGHEIKPVVGWNSRPNPCSWRNWNYYDLSNSNFDILQYKIVLWVPPKEWGQHPCICATTPPDVVATHCACLQNFAMLRRNSRSASVSRQLASDYSSLISVQFKSRVKFDLKQRVVFLTMTIANVNRSYNTDVMLHCVQCSCAGGWRHI
jgi:hypothetical protein